MLPQCYKPAVSKAGVLSPLDKLELPYERTLEPSALFNFGRSQTHSIEDDLLPYESARQLALQVRPELL